MKQSRLNKRVIISGGGTGGHIFPAISIARALQKKKSGIEILFVGAEGKMEMERVPQAGFEIVGLPVKGFQRKLTMDNIKVAGGLLNSIKKANQLIRKFRPDVVIGTGGYASGPVLFVAGRKKIPYLIQEQNSYPGITNKILAGKALKICVAYHGMDKFFPAEKIVFTGNPVRNGLENTLENKEMALRHFKLDESKKTLLVLGGSLGAHTINQAVTLSLDALSKLDFQVIWQCGQIYFKTAKSSFEKNGSSNIILRDFITRMDLAYAAADLVISRAGAGTISELSLTGKPVILVPSPNVAEDHQTKNVMALLENKAAKLVKDIDAVETLIPMASVLIKNEKEMQILSENIKKFAAPDSASRIAEIIIKLADG